MAHPQKNAYRLQVETPKVYLNNAVAHYRAADLQFLSLATDGTHLGGREVLMTGLLTPESGKALWTALCARTLAHPVCLGSPLETADSRQSPPPETFVSESRFRRAGNRQKPPESADSDPEEKEIGYRGPGRLNAGNRRKPPEAEIGRPFLKQISADSALDRSFAGPPAPEGFTRRGDHAWRTGGLG